jgi:hypothetical protein
MSSIFNAFLHGSDNKLLCRNHFISGASEKG